MFTAEDMRNYSAMQLAMRGPTVEEMRNFSAMQAAHGPGSSTSQEFRTMRQYLVNHDSRLGMLEQPANAALAAVQTIAKNMAPKDPREIEIQYAEHQAALAKKDQKPGTKSPVPELKQGRQ